MRNVPPRMEDVDLRNLPPVSFFRAYHVFPCSTPCLEFASVLSKGDVWFWVVLVPKPAGAQNR